MLGLVVVVDGLLELGQAEVGEGAVEVEDLLEVGADGRVLVH